MQIQIIHPVDTDIKTKFFTPIAIYVGNTVHFGQNEIITAKKNLSAFERNRAEKFIHQSDRNTYILSHYFLRKHIAELSNIQAGQIELVFKNNNKPYAKNLGLDFNLSHSKNLFAFCIADQPSIRVGIDIEKIKQGPDFQSIAQSYFHENERNYIFNGQLTSHEQAIRFYTIWTRKEAFLKMVGLGLVEDLNTLDMASQNSQYNLKNPTAFLPENEMTYVYSFATEEYVLSLSISEKCKPIFQNVK